MTEPRIPNSEPSIRGRAMILTAPARDRAAASSVSASFLGLQVFAPHVPGFSERVAASYARARSLAEEAGAFLKDSLPIKRASGAEYFHRLESSPSQIDHLDAIRARVRSAVQLAGGMLRDCLPVKSMSAPAAKPASQLSAQGAIFAKLRAASQDAQLVLLDCFPVRSAPKSGADDSPALAAPSSLSVGAWLERLFARARELADESRAVLLDCLPVKSVPGTGFGQPEAFSATSWLPWGIRFGNRLETAVARARATADEARVLLLDCLPVKSASVRAVDAVRLRAPARPALPLRFPHLADQWQVPAFLLVSFLLVASAVFVNQNARRWPASVEIAAVPRAPEADHHAIAPSPPVRPVEAGPAVAAIERSEEITAEVPGLVTAPAAALPQVAMIEPPGAPGSFGNADAEARGICVKTASLSGSPEASFQSLAPTPDSFGMKLAQVARAQVEGFVIYNDKYRSISYPMGDVPSLFGVCTDVIVRAYRALGLDLQELVHRSRSGSGDRSIDHRRTEVLRRFFTAQGESLPATSFAEDYLPGDIVTYYRPQNRRTRSHIAIVSDVIAPSGRPMIIHNRGWGPEIEDALFVDQITGHYRYYGPAQKKEAERPDADKTAPPAAQRVDAEPKCRSAGLGCAGGNS